MVRAEGATTRRGLLAGAIAVVTGAVVGCDDTREPRTKGTPARDVSQWPGHQPGLLYIGVSQLEPDLSGLEAQVGRLGLHRNFFDFFSIEFEQETIRADHAAGRLPWVSFKPPTTDPGGWDMVSSGAVDDDLRTRARAYAELSDPIVATFHHEPTGDRTGTPEEFSRAFVHIADVMRDETGLENVAFVPVLGEWEFNPVNELSAPERYLTGPVLDRSAFVGLDVYQNASGETFEERIGRVLSLLEAYGRPDLMVGVGEAGCTDRFDMPAVQWWEESFRWASANARRIGAVSYFNSVRNSRPEAYWPLDESAAKTAAFAASVASPRTCLLSAV